MAMKDEYEVARLYSDGVFQRQVSETFEGALSFTFHLAPPILGRKDERTGVPRKMTFGPWMMKVFALLAKLKGLRGTPFDVFGYTAERRSERQTLADYETLLAEIETSLTPANHALATALVALPEKIRGYGHVRARHLAAAKAEEAQLLAQYRGGGHTLPLAAE